MTFQDIFTSSFLENVTAISLIDMALAVLLAFALGLFIFFVYKRTFTGIVYSSGFGVSLIALTMITTVVILAVTSNIVLSLGMVGALSTVRFRAAIKEPVEIVFLFWFLAAGIVIGAGMIPLAIIGSVIIGVILLLLANRKYSDKPYMLVLRCENENAETAAMALLDQSGCRSKVKAKTVTRDSMELSVEVKLKDASTNFVNALSAVEGMHSVSMVSYNGEYMSW